MSPYKLCTHPKPINVSSEMEHATGLKLIRISWTGVMSTHLESYRLRGGNKLTGILECDH